MTGTPRHQRHLLYRINTHEINRIATMPGATKKQVRYACTRALKRTAATLHKRTLAALKEGLAPRSGALLRRRFMVFNLKRVPNQDGYGFRIWYGLDPIKIKSLRGRVTGRIRPRHTLRDKKTGRFIRARRRKQPVGFIPKGSLLEPCTFEQGEVGYSRRERQRTVLIRDGHTRRAHEAKIAIFNPVVGYIEAGVLNDKNAFDIFLHHFETDLRGRIKAGINT